MINELKDKDSQQSHNNQSYRERIKNEQPERHEWLDLLNNTHVRRVVLWLIVANVICVVLETVESVRSWCLSTKRENVISLTHEFKREV